MARDLSQPARPVGRWPVAVLAVGAFVTSLNATALAPLLGPIARDLEVPAAAAGQLATLGAACAAVTALAVAPVMDRRARGAWLRLEGALLAAGTLLTAVAPSFGWLFAGRALAGVGGAVIFGTCLAAVGDLYPEPGRRNRAVGLVGTAGTLGAVLGLPLLALLEATLGWRWAVAALLPPALAVAAGAGRLPAGPGVPRGGPRPGWAAGYRAVLGHRPTVWLLAGTVGLCLVWLGWLVYFGAYAAAGFGVGAGGLGALFLVAGGAELVGNNVVPALVRRYRPLGVAALAAGAVAAALLAVGGAGSALALYPFVAMVSLGCVALWTVATILLLDGPPATRGVTMALHSAAFEVGGALGGAAVGGALAATGDYGVAYGFLGILVPGVLACLALGARRPGAAPAAGPAPAVLVTGDIPVRGPCAGRTAA